MKRRPARRRAPKDLVHELTSRLGGSPDVIVVFALRRIDNEYECSWLARPDEGLPRGVAGHIIAAMRAELLGELGNRALRAGTQIVAPHARRVGETAVARVADAIEKLLKG